MLQTVSSFFLPNSHTHSSAIRCIKKATQDKIQKAKTCTEKNNQYVMKLPQQYQISLQKVVHFSQTRCKLRFKKITNTTNQKFIWCIVRMFASLQQRQKIQQVFGNNLCILFLAVRLEHQPLVLGDPFFTQSKRTTNQLFQCFDRHQAQIFAG